MVKVKLYPGMELEVGTPFSDEVGPDLFRKTMKSSNLMIGENGGGVVVLMCLKEGGCMSEMLFMAIANDGSPRMEGTTNERQVLAIRDGRRTIGELEAWLKDYPFFSHAIPEIIKGYDESVTVELDKMIG